MTESLIVSKSSEITSRQPQTKTQDNLIICLYTLSKQQPDTLQKIDAISVVIGPGSFTGIRVGIAMAKGISLALDKKIIPITNFDLTLNRLPHIESGKKYCVLIPAKPPEYYYAFMQDSEELSKGYIDINVILSGAKNPFNESQLVGDFDDETELKLGYFNFINVRGLKPEAQSMLELSIKYFNEGKLFPSDKIEPLYIKDFIIKK